MDVIDFYYSGLFYMYMYTCLYLYLHLSYHDIQEHRNYNSYHFARSAQARECLWLSQGGGAKPYESWSDEFVRTRQIQMLPVTGDPRCKR